jgi:hypothetical protein
MIGGQVLDGRHKQYSVVSVNAAIQSWQSANDGAEIASSNVFAMH